MKSIATRMLQLLPGALLVLGLASTALSLPALGASKGGSPSPSTPGDFRVTGITTSSVSFAWNASTPGSGGKLGYNIFNDTTGFSLNVGNVTSTTWTVGVQAGGTYSFHIEAYSGTYGNAGVSPQPGSHGDTSRDSAADTRQTSPARDHASEPNLEYHHRGVDGIDACQ